MELSRHFLPRPPMELDAVTVAAFELLYNDILVHGQGEPIRYDLAAPKWQFLSYLTDTKEILMHGSGNADIEEFEPRKSDDSTEFGNRRAVYASSDAIWAMFFAVVDRHSRPTATMNVAFRVMETDGTKGMSYYFFSLDKDALALRPWWEGTMYILPRDSFEQEAPELYQGVMLESAHWASLVPVKPVGKLLVEPEDFPFLNRIVPHDQALINERAKKDPEGFPWLDD